MEISQTLYNYRQKNGRHSLMPAFNMKEVIPSIVFADVKAMSFSMRLFEIITVAAVYYLTARIGQKFAIPPGNVTPVWLPSGILLAAVFIRGYHIWPGILIGAFIGNVWAYIDFTTFSNILKCLFSGTANGMGDVLCIAGGAYLIERTTGTKNPFRKSADVTKFLIFGVIAGPAVSAAFGVTALCMTGFLPWGNYLYTLITWLTGDSIGVLIFAPLIITWFTGSRKATLPGHPFELTAFSLILMVTSTYCLELLPLRGSINIPLFSLAPILIWSAFRLGQRITFTGVFIISVLSVVSTAMGSGPFSGKPLNLSLLELQWFIAVMSSTIFILSGLITEQSEAKNKLEKAHGDLEVRVKERTLELEKSNENLKIEVHERRQAEQRIKHLNRVLRSIRDVNQLIVRERDPEILIHEGCRLLVENRGYTSALIVLTDDNDRPLSWAAAGVASSSESLNAMLESHELPPCCKLIQSATETKLIDDRSGVCEKCPITEERQEAASLCARLIHGDSAFGYITAALERNLNVVDEELSLFSEMAGDLAYALNFSRIEAAHESSKRKRETLEGQLIQAQKMESVGRLAGGVAHDYNNMSSIIIGYSELALEKVDPSDSLHDDLMEIFNAAKRSSDITRQLLAFARQQTIAPKALDLNDTIGNMLKMLHRLIGEDINLAWLPGVKLWQVKIDPSQIDQILANLCVNARDAIVDVGKVTIETENINFDEEYCADHAGFVPGDFVKLTISDDGTGIPPETLENIFEPFFTTKGLGKGTGLGLATVYGIVKQNNGFINVYSEMDKGTSIKIYLPRYAGQPIESKCENDLEIPLSRGNEVVLLVEDDAAILKLGKRILEDIGYMVLSANSPIEALNLAEKHSSEINLLITDVVMPEMNGRELSEKLQNLYPDIETLFMSGYTANVIAHRGVLEDGVSFISKPFSKMDMALKVRKVLDEN